MQVLVISNELSSAHTLSQAFKTQGIHACYITFNDVLSTSLSQEFTFSAIILFVQTAMEMKQMLLLMHNKPFQIPTILLWRATRTVPHSLENICTHHLTMGKDLFDTIRQIKDRVYSYTVNDLYNRSNEEILMFGELTLDRRYRELRIGKQRMRLRNKEFALLEFFMLHPDRLLCRNTILESVWDMNKTFVTNTIDVHIGKLRKMLGGHRDLIQTIHSIGYIFGVPQS